MIHIENDLIKLQNVLGNARSNNKKIAFVATMGNLHKGHLALIEEARRKADFVVASIFVNPTQFGDNEDLDKYPRTLEKDKQLLQERIELLFTPSVDSIYPDGSCTYVDIPHMTKDICGAFRPLHFRGVLTVVNLLFNLIRPDFACFGKKDFQQMRLIERMVQDLHMNVEILEVDTGRTDTGLAHSSRNQYLSIAERKKAALLYTTLKSMRQQIISGYANKSELDALCASNKKNLERSGFSVDYLMIRDYYTLQETRKGKPMIALVAAYLNKTRLIDNIELGVSS